LREAHTFMAPEIQPRKSPAEDLAPCVKANIVKKF
jgi:hypothetical protein